MSTRLATSVCGISLKNPVLAASGTYGYGVEFAALVNLSEVGGVVVKGLSREPMDGNPAPRLYETQAGMINSIGLQNIGVRAFVSEKLPALRTAGTAVFANIFGYAVDDYCEVARVLEDAEGVDGYELNVSCPNTKHGGMFFSSDCGIARRSGERCAASLHTAADREAFAECRADRATGAGGRGAPARMRFRW